MNVISMPPTFNLIPRLRVSFPRNSSAVLLVTVACLAQTLSAQNASPFGDSGGSERGMAPFGGEGARLDGLKRTEMPEREFDLSKVGLARIVETPERYAKIWKSFRSSHALDVDGEFREGAAGFPNDTAETRGAFLRYVARHRPAVSIEEVVRCKACTKGQVPAVQEGLKITYVACKACDGKGDVMLVENFKLMATGDIMPRMPGRDTPPPKPGSPEALVKIGDSPQRVVALLGEPRSFIRISRDRSECYFDNCSIVFESLKVAEPPVMFSVRQESRQASADLRRLLTRFVSTQMEGGGAMYKHPAFSETRYGTMPGAVVLQDGTLMLATKYYGGKWIMHDSVTVKIGDKTLRSSILPPGRPSRSVDAGAFIIERCMFSEEADRDIIRAIASSGGVEVFMALCVGHVPAGGLSEQQFASFTPIAQVSKAEKDAFSDCIALSEALRSKAAESRPMSPDGR